MSQFDQCQFCKLQGVISCCIGCLFYKGEELINFDVRPEISEQIKENSDDIIKNN